MLPVEVGHKTEDRLGVLIPTHQLSGYDAHGLQDVEKKKRSPADHKDQDHKDQHSDHLIIQKLVFSPYLSLMRMHVTDLEMISSSW